MLLLILYCSDETGEAPRFIWCRQKTKNLQQTTFALFRKASIFMYLLHSAHSDLKQLTSSAN